MFEKFGRGRVDGLSFFDSLSPFCFFLNEFHHCTFSISYKILKNLFIIIILF